MDGPNEREQAETDKLWAEAEYFRTLTRSIFYVPALAALAGVIVAIIGALGE